MPPPDKNTSVFLDGALPHVGDLSHAETRRGGEFFSRKERKDHKAGGPTSVSATIDRSGWKRVRLGEALTNVVWCNYSHLQPRQVRKVTQGDDTGEVSITTDYYHPASPVVLFGDHTCNVKYVDFDCLILGDGVKLLTPNHEVFSTRFLYYLVQYVASKLPQGYARHLAVLKETECALPCYEDQFKIANAITSIDTHISALQALIAKYEAIKKATVNLLLKPTGIHIVRLGEVANISRGGSPRPIQDYITVDPDGINWIKIGDVSVDAKYIEQTEERIKPTGIAMSRQVKAGDFILSNSMSFGRPYILKIDGCIHDGWLAIQNYQNTFDVDYLYYLLGSDMVFAQYIENAAGSSVKNLNKDIVAKITLPSPPLSEQCKIAEQITAIDNVLADYKAQLEKARQLKAGMMSYFFG